MDVSSEVKTTHKYTLHLDGVEVNDLLEEIGALDSWTYPKLQALRAALRDERSDRH